MPNAILWKRKVNRQWNTVLQSWVACSEFIQDEEFVLLRLTGLEFAQHMRSPFAFYDGIELLYSKKKIILFIVGIENYYKAKRKEEVLFYFIKGGQV